MSDRIEEIRKRAEAATAGPWVPCPRGAENPNVAQASEATRIGCENITRREEAEKMLATEKEVATQACKDAEAAESRADVAEAKVKAMEAALAKPCGCQNGLHDSMLLGPELRCHQVKALAAAREEGRRGA